MEQDIAKQSFLEKRRNFYLESQKAGRKAFFEKSRAKLGDRLIEREEEEEFSEEYSISESNFETKEVLQLYEDLRINEAYDEKNLISSEKKAIKKMKSEKLRRENFPSFESPSPSNNSKYLQLSEYLIDIPKDLNPDNFIVLSRPDGAAGILTCRKGSCVLNDKFGRLLHKFSAQLPGGSPQDSKRKDAGCVLECIYNKSSGKIYIIDILIWNCQSFIECSFEFRRFWILGNIKSPMNSSKALNTPQFLTENPLPELHIINNVFPANPSGLRAAYNEISPYTKDGFLFYDKRGWYCFGLSPYLLFWRDRVSSFYCGAPSESTEMQEEGIVCLLRSESEGSLLTSDQIPVDSLNEEEKALYKEVIEKRSLLKVFFSSISVEDLEANASGDVSTVKVISKGRRVLGDVKSKTDRADHLSKILFNLQLQRNPITIEKIVKSLELNCQSSE